ncbi:hypothetical protein [Frankia canadensis]|nr:hypothetical protein [Frankia canadensis]
MYDGVDAQAGAERPAASATGAARPGRCEFEYLLALVEPAP